MSNVVVERDPVDTPPPRRTGPLIAVAGAVLLVLFGLFGRSETGVDPEAALGVAATTTTQLVREFIPGTVTGQTLLDAELLAAGPSIEWSDLALPPGVMAVLAIGEFDGRLALLASREPPDASGLVPGVELFLEDGSDGWREAGFAIGAGEQVVTADIGPSGFVVVTSLRDAAQLPYESDHTVVYGSADGIEWLETTLSMPGDERLTNIQATVGTESSASWVTALLIADDFPEMTAALPGDIRGLVERGSARVSVDGDRVIVRLPLGYPVFEAPLSALGLSAAGREPEVTTPALNRRTTAAWVSDDRLGFDPAPESPAGTQVIASLIRGVDGRLLALDAARQILASGDGQEWAPAGDLGNLGFGTATIQSIDGTVVSIQNRSVQFLDDDAAEYVLAPPQGRGISPHVAPAGGPAGLALLTASNGPDYAVRTAEVSFESGGRTLIVDPGDRTITVYDDGTVVDVFESPTDDARAYYDPGRETLVLDGRYELSVDELERAYLARLVPATRGPYGVAFSPDGIEWGWSALVDDSGSPAGPVALLSVGESNVYAVLGRPALPNTPAVAGDTVPRLLVGAIGD